MSHTTKPDPFALNAAAALYDNNARPRLLLSGEDIASLQPTLQTENGQAILAVMRQRCNEIADHVEQAGDKRDALLTNAICEPHLGGRRIPSLDDLALLGVMEDQPRYRDACRSILLAAAHNDQQDMKVRATLLHGSARTITNAYDLLHSHLSDQDRATIHEWLWQVGVVRYLDEIAPAHMTTGGANIPLRMLLGAIFSLLALGPDASAFASDEELAAIRTRLLRYLDASLWGCFGSEGYPHEDVAYGNASLGIVIPLVDALKRAGWVDAYARHARMRAAGEALLHFVQPWGDAMTVLGDAGDNYHDRELSLGRLGVETNNPALLWLMTQLHFPAQSKGQWSELSRFYHNVPITFAGNDGQLPASFYTLLVLPHLPTARHPRHRTQADPPIHFVDAERGLVSQRTSWDADALMLIVDGSQRNTITRGHEHDSASHVSLSAQGEYFGICRGRYSQRRAFQNVVVIDQPHDGDDDWHYRPTRGRLVHHQPGTLSSWTRVDASQQANANWSYRDAGLVQGEGLAPYAWVVDDVNFDDGHSGMRDYHWRWHTSPGNQVTIDNSVVTIKGWRHGHTMSIHFAAAASQPDQPVCPKLQSSITRCGSPAYISDEMVRTRREQAADEPWMQVHGPVFECPTIDATITGYSSKMVSLLLPHDPGAQPADQPRFLPINTLQNTVGFQLHTPQVVDTFLYAFDHGVLQYEDIEGLGRWCLVRRDAQTGHVIAYQFGGGAWLKVAGRTLS